MLRISNTTPSLRILLAGITSLVLSVLCLPTRAGEPEGDPDRGQMLYQTYSCYACHGHTGETGTGTRLNPPRFDQATFMTYVRNPSGRIIRRGAGGWMPPYKGVSDQNLADIYAWLSSLPSYSPPLEGIPLLNMDEEQEQNR